MFAQSPPKRVTRYKKLDIIIIAAKLINIVFLLVKMSVRTWLKE